MPPIREELEFIKQKIASGKEPWKTAWEKLRISASASLDHKPRPRAEVVRGPYNNPNIGSSEFSNDSAAAYTHALQWCLTGNEAHARKAIEILNAWSATLKTVSGHDTKLLIGMTGVKFCNAAELLRHTYAGWKKQDQKRFERLLREILYPPIKDFFPAANGNWDASMIQTMLAMGVFLDEDLDDWEIIGGTSTFEGKDGAIRGVCLPKSESTYLYTRNTNFADFIFTCELKWEVEGNTGVMFRAGRTAGKKGATAFGPQMEMEPFSQDRDWSGGIYGQGCGGWYYPLWLKEHAEARQAQKPDGWNRMTIEARGPEIRTWLNGVPVACWKTDKFLTGAFRPADPHRPEGCRALAESEGQAAQSHLDQRIINHDRKVIMNILSRSIRLFLSLGFVACTHLGEAALPPTPARPGRPWTRCRVRCPMPPLCRRRAPTGLSASSTSSRMVGTLTGCPTTSRRFSRRIRTSCRNRTRRFGDREGRITGDSHFTATTIRAIRGCIRRHANLLADAGVDTVIFDTTNRRTYPEVYRVICRVWSQILKEGGRVPRLCFMVNTKAGETADEIYATSISRDCIRNCGFAGRASRC